MNWLEVKICVESSLPELAMELIPNLFHDLGLKGVVIEEEEKLNDFAVIGYIPADNMLEHRHGVLQSELQRLKQVHGMRFKILSKEIAEEDWAESWKAFFKPERIGRRIVIKPTWKQYKALSDQIVIEIDPGMAFGTGTHPTTQLCIQMMETYLKPGQTFLDIGTGSGILMLAAAKLGAARMLGIDSDPMAVGIAKKNLLLNRVGSDRWHVRTGHLTEGVTGRYQLVVANISTDTILLLIDDVKTVLAEGGTFIVSGITEENIAIILDRIHSSGLRCLETRKMEEWAAIAVK
ncbi:MAG: 50S ribosomal protein L11 methyltransferase [Deltaproteobacteria bacterium]|nr:50S ribosomal protein L11 methyltransferase [Deltaproteobacteria bacterium]